VTIWRGIGDEKHIRIASAFRWDELAISLKQDEDESPKDYRKMRIREYFL
jgi:hypothetical protein